MNIDKQTETTVTEKVIIEMTPQEAWLLWGGIMYLNADWHLVTNFANGKYKVEGTDQFKALVKELERGLEDHMDVNSDLKSVQTYEGL